VDALIPAFKISAEVDGRKQKEGKGQKEMI